jgi:hypothetical protein
LMGYSDGRDVTLEEKLAIFLYACVTGLTVRHLGERFQRANGTITKYFCLSFFKKNNTHHRASDS